MAVKAGERNVPDTPQNRQLNAVWYARELAVYTIQICKNKKVFLPEYQSALTDDIIRTAKDIYINYGSGEANYSVRRFWIVTTCLR